MRSVTRVEFPGKENKKELSLPKKRIAVYVRVSTVMESQQNSLQAQRTYFEQYIKQHRDWVLAGIYEDDGASDLSIKQREGFSRMLEDAFAGKFDIIITKSLSRFARNTVDLLQTVRKLREKGIAVYFQRENINTLNAAGEFLITLLASFAEEESRSISENIRWGIRRQFERGNYPLPSRLYGYCMDDGELTINSEQAKVVRFIYLLALSGKCDHDIANILTDFGYLSPKSVALWRDTTVKGILRNEKFKGDARLQKDRHS